MIAMGESRMKLDGRRKPALKSLVVQQSVNINGRHTSVTLEAAFWKSLKEIAGIQSVSAAALLSTIDKEREATNLSSALRVYVIEHYRLAASARTGDNG